MNFAKWLQNELNKRAWSQSDLVRHIKAGGYKITRSQITHILKSDIKASGDVCISIAYGLGVSREEVFRARGWLLPKPDDPFGPEIDPRALELAKEVSVLPVKSRELAFSAIEPMLYSIRELTSEIHKLSLNGQQA
ncbi:MAG: hypothetical protein ACPGWR_25060 [Ardenticatenaceae bacterium]